LQFHTAADKAGMFAAPVAGSEREVADSQGPRQRRPKAYRTIPLCN